MTKQELIAAVGAARYWDASSELTRIALRDDYGSSACPESQTDLPHNLSPDIWDASMAEHGKVSLFFDVYDDLPSYGMLMYAAYAYREMSPLGRSQWWEEVRKRFIGEKAALRNPLLYALWCDYFENQDTVQEAWLELTNPRQEGLLRVVLPISGPVPWGLKQSIYEETADEPSMRQFVFEALVRSAFDVFGKLDATAARKILAKLEIPEKTMGFLELTTKLAE